MMLAAMKNGRLSLPRIFLLILFASPLGAPAQEQKQPVAGLASIRQYISAGWDNLTRSMTDCASVVDPKMKVHAVIYLPAGFAVPPAVEKLHTACDVDIEHLPKPIHQLGEIDTNAIHPHGLLYLENKYVVPGGRFNEMYGWDSYFIILGLLRDGRTDLARGMVENFFFEIGEYGAILNANRTYFFTRSQPPFLSSMIREVYEHSAAGSKPDLKWLGRAYPLAQRDYALWTSPEHQAGATGLARYHDLGEGPVPEMTDDASYYSDVIHWLLAHPRDHPEYLVDGPVDPTPAQAATLAKTSCDVAISHVCARAVVDGHRLSAAYYRSDRAMRESGFDTSFRFGPFSGSTEDYAPVCLNSLLYKYEQDMAHFATLLGRRREAAEWSRRASSRRQAIDHYLWDAELGLYLDYNFATGKRSSYHFISTFYPLWSGVASPQQAKSVQTHLALFERPGGLATSDYESGVQWDLPFGWAPTNWLSVSGLDRYGYHDDAARIARDFSQAILDNFLHDGTIREKYNVADGSANVKVAAGYKNNVVGFGWSNAVYLKMQDLIAASSHR
jgi:alpha,alpha-trehalase